MISVGRFAALALVFVSACAGGKDSLDGTSHDVRADAGAPRGGAYAYAAKRPLVAVGLADSRGLGDEETHRVVDALAESASACFKRSANLTAGAARITLPIDDGGIVGAPEVAFSPTEAAPQGMLCVLAPLRMTTFAPAAHDAGARSITLESAWGP